LLEWGNKTGKGVSRARVCCGIIYACVSLSNKIKQTSKQWTLKELFEIFSQEIDIIFILLYLYYRAKIKDFFYNSPGSGSGLRRIYSGRNEVEEPQSFAGDPKYIP
jgi:hypothetical protein